MSGTFHRDTTVAELGAWWLDTVARHRVRPSTFGKYTSRVAKITATLGVMPARSLKAEHVARWQSELLKGSLASGTVGDLRVALHMVMEQGVIHELIAANPVDRVAAPKVVRSAKRALVAPAQGHGRARRSDARPEICVAIQLVTAVPEVPTSATSAVGRLTRTTVPVIDEPNWIDSNRLDGLGRRDNIRNRLLH
jgi:hypothetical protein